MRNVLSPKVVVAAVFVCAMFMNIMDQTVVNVALPTLSRNFGVPLASVTGVVTAYLVTIAVVMPASGWLGDKFGAKPVMLTSIALFTGTSVLCGISTSLPELVAFRALQGLGGGMLVPVGMAMLFRAFPPAERIRANRILMVPTLLAPASGPVIGGALVSGLSWRWIFFINVPVGVGALIFGLLFLPGGAEHPVGRFDLRGFLLAATGFPLFMFAISTGATSGWASPSVLATGLPGVALLAAFVAVALRAPAPLLLQDGLGFSAIHSGLMTFPEALGGMSGIQITSRLYKKVGPRRLMMAGMTGTVLAIGGMAFAGTSAVTWLIPVLMFFTGASFGFAMAPSQTASFATISNAKTGQASTVTNTLRQVAGAAGVALIGTLIGSLHAGPGNLGGFRVAFGAAAVLMAAAFVFASRVSDADAAPTMAETAGDPREAPLPEPA